MKKTIVAIQCSNIIETKLIQKFELKNYNFVKLELLGDIVEIIEHINVDLFLINIKKNEHEIIKLINQLKNRFGKPIITITSSSSKYDRVLLLKSGVNDYIITPFLDDELEYKILQSLKKSYDFIITDSGIEINLIERTVYYENKLVKTKPTMFNFLCYLIQHKGEIITRDDIMRNIFDTEHYLTDRKIDTQIKQMRKIINPAFIKTKRGVGYSYVGEKELAN